MKKFFALFLILFWSLAASAQTDYRACDTVGNWDMMAEQVNGGYVGDCTVDLDVDDQLSTTVSQDSASGQANIYIAAVTNLAAGDVLVIHPGGAREEACIISSVHAAVDEIDDIDFSAVPDASTWTITVDGQTTSALQFNDNAGTIQTAVRALSSVGNTTTVTGNYTSGFTISFLGVDAGTDKVVSVDGSTLTSSSNPVTVTLVETIKGRAIYPVCTTNLVYTHTSVQADPVYLSNRVGPLTACGIYEISFTNSSVVGIATQFTQGNAKVLATANSAILEPGEKLTIRVPKNYLYFSVKPLAGVTGGQFRVCPKVH